MAGKYAGIIDKLPRLVPERSPYQDKVQAVKDQILLEQNVTWLPASVLARDYRELRDEVDTIEEQLSAANLRLEAVKQLMVAQFDAEDVTSIALGDGAHVRVQKEPYAQVKDKEAFRQWCIKHGFEMQMVLPWATTNSLTKELLTAGKPEPDGVEAAQLDKVVLRRK
jgi:hypothetical protein